MWKGWGDNSEAISSKYLVCCADSMSVVCVTSSHRVAGDRLRDAGHCDPGDQRARIGGGGGGRVGVVGGGDACFPKPIRNP